MNKYQKMDEEKMLAMQYSKRDIEVIDVYKKVVDKVNGFCNELGIRNVSDIFNVFSILAHEGYLSYGRNMALEPSDNFDIYLFEGADILIGKGNCRNFSNFLELLYRTRGNDSFVVANYLYGVNDSNFNRTSRLLQRMFKFNHACCLVEENDVQYIFDPSNVEAYVHKGLKYQTGNRDGKLRINFDKTYLLNAMTKEDLNKIKTFPRVYLSYDDKKKQYIESKAGVLSSAIFNELNNTDCMEEFHESIKYELSYVKRLTKK